MAIKKEGTIGAAAFLAMAAVVGYTVQTGPKPMESGAVSRAAESKRAKPAVSKTDEDTVLPGCRSLQDELKEFLAIRTLAFPPTCYADSKTGTETSPADLSTTSSDLKFVIALLPDPVHTHASTFFDQFTVVIQEAAQDEGYDFDESWFPWDDDSASYALLADEKASGREKQMKEDQPGIILFRKTIECTEEKLKLVNGCKEEYTKSYRQGLIVFVVGEEATHGIHREQFFNALEWIADLQPRVDPKKKTLAILGPSFSGSLPSVAAALSELSKAPEDEHTKKIKELVNIWEKRRDNRLAIFSGSISSKSSAGVFQNSFQEQVKFHSFVQNDDEILKRFCNYITKEQPEFDAGKMAILSEDETAYGGSGVKPVGEDEGDSTGCADRALRLYYPRDISALRGAYQTKSLFDFGGPSTQTSDPQKRTLPSDLADPTGKVHDSIRSYGGNQTPLAQEAFLMEIVAALRELHARYILVRSSNTLDQLFLTNFLKRSYPNGRIVIFGSDLMFIRERGTTGLSGVMTLSTYPLFPLERDWTEHQSHPAADRTFSGDNPEGTYIAFRLLLNDESIYRGEEHSNRCRVLEDAKEYQIFVPAVSCTDESPFHEVSPPIPDYSPPFWSLANQCGELKYGKGDEKCTCPSVPSAGDECPYPGPATWLSVVGANRFWPLAAMTKDTPKVPEADKRTAGCPTDRGNDPGGRPEMTLGMKTFWVILVGFAAFHAWCCWSGSFTGKPAFRAHFASTGDWRHLLLVFVGSCCVVFFGMVAAWGSGVFWIPLAGLAYPVFAYVCVGLIYGAALLAILGIGYTTWRLSEGLPNRPKLPKMTDKYFVFWSLGAPACLVIGTSVFYFAFINSLDGVLLAENRVLTYWRSMHLGSGVSPIVPMFAILAGFYLAFWLTLHGLALFGPDRPCLPPAGRLLIRDANNNQKEFLRMFSQEDAGRSIENAALPLDRWTGIVGVILFLLFVVAAAGLAHGVPVRSLGARLYAAIFVIWLDLCCVMAIVEAWRFNKTWVELKRLLSFIDRIPLRRTLAIMHGFSWGSVWKMSGNVLEVRYKVISRQMECMNHTIESLQDFVKIPANLEKYPRAASALAGLLRMQKAGTKFADWYCINYREEQAGDLRRFRIFQKTVAAASGALLTNLLVPVWREEKESLVAGPIKAADEKDEASPAKPPQTKNELIRNAEEFVCLTYLGFIQNILGRMRTMALTVMAMLLAATVAASTYPFDPRQALSMILIVLFAITGAVIVKVYAEMHRDTTLSYVTNTNPGELGMEFWLKILGFGFAPLIGLLTRIFPGIADFVFSWLQPGVSALK